MEIHNEKGKTAIVKNPTILFEELLDCIGSHLYREDRWLTMEEKKFENARSKIEDQLTERLKRDHYYKTYLWIENLRPGWVKDWLRGSFFSKKDGPTEKKKDKWWWWRWHSNLNIH